MDAGTVVEFDRTTRVASVGDQDEGEATSDELDAPGGLLCCE
jgi:hypothetical protein